MYEQANTAQGRPASRIESEIERVKIMTGRVQRIRATVVSHARSLGYFEPQTEGKGLGVAPTPIISTLSDALGELDREIENLDGALNLFN